MNDLIQTVWANYNWAGSLLALLAIVVITKTGKFIAWKVPALAEMKAINRERDKPKYKKDKYPPVLKASERVGLYCNLTFFIVILPFCVTLELPAWWMIPLHVAAILLFEDFFYYLTHRFWFHGNGKMRKVHAVHHQARKPTYIDALYVHPLETFIGLCLFMGTVIVLSVLMGPFDVITVALAFVIYTQINTINHTFVDLPYFPFKSLTWITERHHAHHIDMHHGNYASINLLYDKLFGTFE